MACGKSLEDGQNWPSRRQEKGQRESAKRQKGLYTEIHRYLRRQPKACIDPAILVFT